MKHLLICILAGLIILTGLTTLMTAEQKSNKDIPYTDPDALQVMNPGDEEEHPPIQVGLIVERTQTMEEIHFRRVLENAQEEGFLFHPCETGSSPDTQWEMFQKMLRQGYEVILLDLVHPAAASRYVDAALAQDVKLIFLHQQPPDEVLLKGEGIYYLGFSDADSLWEVAQQIGAYWRSNQGALDYFPDGQLAFASLSNQSFEETGKAEKFQSYLAALGIESYQSKDSVSSMFSFDIHKEIDRIWVADSELVLLTSSAEARKSLDYLLDPTEFAFNRLKLVLLTADGPAQKMVEDGEILLAIGTDGQDLGQAALEMLRAIAAGEAPAAKSVGVGEAAQRCILVPNRVVRSPLLDQRPPVPESTGDEEE